TIVMSTHFLAGITPSNTGGGAAEICLLSRSGFKWGEASSLSLSCGFFYQIGFLLLFFITPASLPLQGFFKTILVIFLSYGVGFSLFFLISQNQRLFPRIITKLVQIPPKYFPRYVKYDEKEAVSAIQDFLWEIRSGFELLFYRKPYYFLLNIAMYALHFFFLFATTHFVILSLGFHIPFPEVVKRQVPAFFLFRLTPTPGGSGGIELALVSAFTPFLGESHSGSLILLWRILTYYLTLAVGGITFLRTIKRI
ncbi:MAG: lysylphosphatidylglycerol synthase transmembrane domain-containing protein, partial [Candidatus Caldatribacteriaceae bacterium]